MIDYHLIIVNHLLDHLTENLRFMNNGAVIYSHSQLALTLIDAQEGKGVTTDLHTYSLTRIDPDNTKNTKKNKGKDLGLMKSINRPSTIFDVPTH